MEKLMFLKKDWASFSRLLRLSESKDLLKTRELVIVNILGALAVVQRRSQKRALIEVNVVEGVLAPLHSVWRSLG